jgi:putative NADH-flavin reductase
MKVAVIGSFGRVGSRIVAELVWRGHSVVGGAGSLEVAPGMTLRYGRVISGAW